MEVIVELQIGEDETGDFVLLVLFLFIFYLFFIYLFIFYYFYIILDKYFSF